MMIKSTWSFKSSREPTTDCVVWPARANLGWKIVECPLSHGSMRTVNEPGTLRAVVVGVSTVEAGEGDQVKRKVESAFNW
jgi:hypothetical protein